MSNEHHSDENLDQQPGTSGEARPRRQGDDRRSRVNPSDNPVPNSPEADEEAVGKGEEILERVKPY
jgi:hypothetical protein